MLISSILLKLRHITLRDFVSQYEKGETKVIQTYPVWGQESHADYYKTTLAGPEGKCLFNMKRIHDLKSHDSCIPVCELLRNRAGRAMTQWLNGQEIDCIGQCFLLKLHIKERRGCAHGVDEHDGRFRGVQGATRESIPSTDAAEMGDLDCCRRCHCVS